MDDNELQKYIAKRVAKELEDGIIVNLGIGIPAKVAEFVPPGLSVLFQSENGCIGIGAAVAPEKADSHTINAWAQPVGILPGGCFFDSETSFGIIRGGHLDLAVVGALQVDERGSIANYMIPGKMVPGMGAAMDLLSGARRVVVAMRHTAKGEHKILKKCTLPFTAIGAVDLIVTEMCVIEVVKQGLLLKEINPEYTLEQVLEATGAELIISENI